MNKRILYLAIPNILSNLSVPLLGVVDTAIIGHLDQVYYLGAIAVASILFDFIFWGFGFLRMGTTGLVAQAFGANNTIATKRILLRVLLVGAFFSTIILAIQKPLLEGALFFIDASDEVEHYVREYYQIRIFAAPATLALFGINGWFLGMQNARYPMLITIVLNVFNLFLNLLFILQFNLNVTGVAWGSLISSYIALGLAFILYRKRYFDSTFDFDWITIFDKKEIKKFFSVNTDIFIRTLCLIFSYAFFTAKSAEEGDTVLAANTILLQLWYVSAYGVDGFAFAAESLVGKYLGAKNLKQLKKAVKGCLFWGVSFGLLGTVVYWGAGTYLIILFTDQPAIIQTATIVLGWTIIAPLINSICFIWDGVYIGATSTSAMRNSMLFATFCIFVPVYYISIEWIGIHSLWVAMLTFMITRGVTLTIYSRKYIFKPIFFNT